MTATLAPKTINPTNNPTNSPTNSPTNNMKTTSQAKPVAKPATRSFTDNLAAMPAATRSEWIKLTTLRSNKVIAGFSAIASGLAAWAIAQFVTDPTTTADLITFPTVFVAVFGATVGILVFSSEVQHGSITPTLAGQPSRAVIAASKAIITAGAGIFLALVSMGGAAIGSELGGNIMGDTATLGGDIGRAALYGALASVLGLGIGMITKQSAAAISGLLAWWLVVEGLVQAFVSETYTRFMPFSAGSTLLGLGDGPPGEPVSETALSYIESGLVFGGYAAAAVAIGTLLLYKRDSA